MWIKRTKTKEQRLLEYDRAMLRSAFVSLFWAAVSERKRRGKYTLQMLADRLGTDKSGVSRWFSKDPPNWRIDTISDIANALDLDVELRATDRITGTIFASSGIYKPTVHVTTRDDQRPIIISSSAIISSSTTETEQMTPGPLKVIPTAGVGITQFSGMSVAAQ
jgi:hypothetical protein